MIYLDSETAGFVGPAVIWQHAVDDGPVETHHVWRSPVRDTLNLIERFCNADSICGFNLGFDWFMANKDYNVLRHFSNLDAVPTLEEWKANELRGSREALCLKPRSALDLYLHALRGPMQVLMDRDPIVIRRVPRLLAPLLCAELAKRVHLADIFFKYGESWHVDSSRDEDFPDIVLEFGATAALKPLVEHVLKLEVVEFPVPPGLLPKDDKKTQYFPWHVKRQWPEKLPGLVEFWYHNEKARHYAEEDVRHLQRLRQHWGNPAPGDDDSVLACAVAATRWRGFALDRDQAKKVLADQVVLARSEVRAAGQVQKLLMPLLSDVEKLVVKDTAAATLEQLVHWNLDGSHTGSGEDGQAVVGTHPAARLSSRVIEARTAEKRANVAGKLWRVGSFHPDFKVLGAKSARMSGAGGLNAHGIDNWAPMRSIFLFAFPGEAFSGGDFVSFEPFIADAAYGDLALRRDLTSGKKIHGLFGEMAYELDYNIIVSNKAAGGLYDRSKKGYLAFSYGAQAGKLSVVLDKEEKQVQALFLKLSQRYPQMMAYRERRAMEFCSMRQPRGIGTRVEWHKPADYIASLLGDRRYFTLENQICETLFNLAQDMPESFHDLGKFQVKRRDRTQTATGACQTALYAAAFGIQGSNMRAALNHEIQSTGARITKATQRRIWDLQPSGIHAWVVRIMQVHDELLVVHNNIADAVHDAVKESIVLYKKVVPLLAIDWRRELRNWSDMK